MTTPTLPTLLLVGCGKMGGALLERWKSIFPETEFHVIDPHHVAPDEGNVLWHRNLESFAKNIFPTVIVFAVKPQQLEEILPSYRARFTESSPLYISIAAGKHLGFYLQHLGDHARVVRAMPNMPALIGEGVTALCALSTLSASAKKMATDMMQAAGHVEWLETESLMNAATAISGCGPAYMFLFAESIIKAGVACGLSETLAKTLALHTLSGSLQLSDKSSKSFSQLCSEIASPGGATQAALDILTHENALEELMKKAILAAKDRSEHLS